MGPRGCCSMLAADFQEMLAGSHERAGSVSKHAVGRGVVRRDRLRLGIPEDFDGGLAVGKEVNVSICWNCMQG